MAVSSLLESGHVSFQPLSRLDPLENSASLCLGVMLGGWVRELPGAFWATELPSLHRKSGLKACLYVVSLCVRPRGWTCGRGGIQGWDSGGGGVPGGCCVRCLLVPAWIQTLGCVCLLSRSFSDQDTRVGTESSGLWAGHGYHEEGE